MAAARERQTRIFVYDTEADALENINGTEYTTGIVADTQRFEHVFFSSFPSFGEANAALFQCEIENTGDLTGKWIRVKYLYYANDSAATMSEMWLFCGMVDSCKYDRQKLTRTLVAYDKLYALRFTDISEWWSTYWEAQTANKTYAAFVADMCAAFGVVTDWQNLSDAYAEIKVAAAKALTLAGCTFTDMLGYVGQLTRYHWYIRENGKLGRGYVHNDIYPTAVDANLDAANTEIGDTALPAYGTLMAYSGADVIYTGGSGAPVYTIRDNPLLEGKTSAQIVWELDALRPKLDVTGGYYPINMECIVSAPETLNTQYDNARNITTTDGSDRRKHVIGSIELWGPQLLYQRVVCPDEMETGAALSPSMSAAIDRVQQMGVEMTYKVNADNVIEAVNLEAQGGVQINAEAININGVISANGNTKINTDGTLEAVNGIFSGEVNADSGAIGGWELDETRLYKSGEYEVSETVLQPPINLQPGRLRFVESIDHTHARIVNVDAEDISAENITAADHVKTAMYNEEAGGGRNARHGFYTGGWYQDGTTVDGKEYYSELTPETLKVMNRDIMRTHRSLVGGWGTAIAANVNLNTAALCAVGKYYCGQDTTAGTLTNCPTRYAFTMDVSAPISSDYENTSYIVREMTTRYGDKYVQYVTGSSTKTYSKWVMSLSNASDNKIFNDQLTSRNIANNATIRQGSFNAQGQETSATNRIRTGFIGALPNTQYSIRTNTSLQVYEIHEYTSGQAFIKYTAINAGSVVFKTSNTTGYFRILMRYSDNSTVPTDEGATLQVERGESFSPYSPHVAPETVISLPQYSYNDLGTASTDAAFFPAWLKRIGRNYDTLNTRALYGRVQPNASGVVYGYMYGGVNAYYTPLYSGFIYVSVGGFKWFGTNNGTFFLRSMNYTSEV